MDKLCSCCGKYRPEQSFQRRGRYERCGCCAQLADRIARTREETREKRRARNAGNIRALAKFIAKAGL